MQKRGHIASNRFVRPEERANTGQQDRRQVKSPATPAVAVVHDFASIGASLARLEATRRQIIDSTPAAKAPAPASQTTSVVFAPALALVSAPALVLPGQRQDLKRICGIGELIEKKLNQFGITRYEQIAAWNGRLVIVSAEKVGIRADKIGHENWVEQAKILASGGKTAFSNQYDRRQEELARPQSPAASTMAKAAIASAAAAVQGGKPPSRKSRR